MPPHVAALGVLVAAILTVASGCSGPQVPEPEFARSPAAAYVEVPYPPPAALAEIIPPSPRDDAVWVDGQWFWRGSYWVWDKGAWVIPPKGARFAPWSTAYRADGTLLFAEASWRDARGEKLPAPQVLEPASAPPTEQTAERAAVP